MLDCIRSKFNTRCEGSAGTLLSEVFVRPIAATQNKLSILRPILGTFMPEQCGYLTKYERLLSKNDNCYFSKILLVEFEL